MTIPRLFTEHDLREGAEIEALPGQGRYLGQVLRRGPGDPVLLFNGRDGEFAAEVAAVRKDQARFRLGHRTRPQPAPGGPRLLLAALKREAMEWTVEKATELGVAAILPVLATRCVATAANLSRLELVAREAAEQCERLDLPALSEAAPLHAALDRWAREGEGHPPPVFLAAERGAAPGLAQALAAHPAPAGAGLLIGPEGGFTGAELDALRRRPFVVPVALGPRILRAETAAVSGLAVLQACCGDWAGSRA
ncbi:16S rRNA (uracil(1498)-N(3))-methyltransferase [Roseomonas sp. BN140053]|uniref:16S rRNA (uracil(1498)-N(3))-methyltransferase n=1 Tax=Roseomonas sp. BN140053 TaxID=3391898 RepID=UPI0039E8BEDF